MPYVYLGNSVRWENTGYVPKSRETVSNIFTEPPVENESGPSLADQVRDLDARLKAIESGTHG